MDDKWEIVGFEVDRAGQLQYSLARQLSSLSYKRAIAYRVVYRHQSHIVDSQGFIDCGDKEPIVKEALADAAALANIALDMDLSSSAYVLQIPYCCLYSC